jgi:RNA polymerase sigma factor (sigma-70 family)
MSEAATPGMAGSGAGLTRVLSDDRLTRRAAGGDQRAFAAIFDRYHQHLYRYCLTIVGDAQDAEDALQNTMVKVLRALPGEGRRIELKPWLYRIAHNESIELLRRRRDAHRLDPELAATGTGLTAEVASRERLRQLIADLDELPERQRGALVMRELAGLDFAEIGIALGTSAAVARQTLYEARLGLGQMDEGREMSCESVTEALSDGDGRVARRRDLRAHLRSCASCRRFGEEIASRERDLAALSPLPAVAAVGMLQGLLGAQGGGAGLAGALGGGAAKSLGATAALKGAATVAVVAAIGVGAADRGGVIDAGLPGGDSQAPSAQQPGADPARTGASAVDSNPVDPPARPAAGQESAGHLGAARTAKLDAGKTASSDDAPLNAEATPAPAAQHASAAHPHGKGHEKQLPAASAHGQQAAATHKNAHAGSTHPQHPTHPAKPSHPVHPASPGAERKPSAPSSGAVAPEAQPPGNAAAQTGGAEDASPPHEAGKKP